MAASLTNPDAPSAHTAEYHSAKKKERAPTHTAVRINLKGLSSKRSQSQKIQDQTPSTENSPGGRLRGRGLGDTAQKDQGGAWADVQAYVSQPSHLPCLGFTGLDIVKYVKLGDLFTVVWRILVGKKEE